MASPSPLSPSFSINMDFLRNYYAHQDNSTFDEMESGSITPRAIVNGQLPIGIKKYQSVCDSSQLPSVVTRYVIERSPDYKTKEEDVLRKAINYLMDPSMKPYGNPSADNVILVDVFVWEKDMVEFKDGQPEFHTVCLCKQSDIKLILIDPSDILKTSKQISAITKTIAPGISIDPINFGSKNPKEVKFYAPPNGLISTPAIGRQEGDRRDCIDIAVKIAFVLIEAQKDSRPLADALLDVSGLSNQDVNGKLNIKNASKGTLIRGLQCSSRQVRDTVIKLFQNSEDIYKYVAPIKHEDLEIIHGSQEKYREIVSKLEKSLKAVGRLSLRGFQKIVDLHRILEDFNREMLFGASIVIDSALDIEEYIFNKDLNWTELHLAVIESKVTVKDVLESYKKLKPPQRQKLIGWADAHGQTALHWAADRGSKEDCESLCSLMSAEQVYYQMNGRLQTALHFAVHANRPELVEILLSRDDVREELVGIQDAYGQTALHAATVPRIDIKIFKALCNSMSPEQLLLTKHHDHTALHLAVHENRPELVEILLSRDDVREELVGIQDAYGQTALEYARKQGLNFSKISEILDPK